MLTDRDDLKIMFSENNSETAILSVVADAHAIIVRNGNITRAIIEAASELEVVCRTGVRVDNVDIPALNERGIPLTITPGANATSVAEHAMYLLLSLAKQSRVHHRAVKEGDFGLRFEMRARDIENKRLLIIGFGRIGSRAASRAQGFGSPPSYLHSCRPVDPADVWFPDPVGSLVVRCGSQVAGTDDHQN